MGPMGINICEVQVQRGPGAVTLAPGESVSYAVAVTGRVANEKAACPDAVLVFIAPPSLAILKERLVGRGTETQESINIRTATALKELTMLPKYDYMVINDVVEEAVGEMESILTAELVRTDRNTESHLQHHIPAYGHKEERSGDP